MARIVGDRVVFKGVKKPLKTKAPSRKAPRPQKTYATEQRIFRKPTLPSAPKAVRKTRQKTQQKKVKARVQQDKQKATLVLGRKPNSAKERRAASKALDVAAYKRERAIKRGSEQHRKSFVGPPTPLHIKSERMKQREYGTTLRGKALSNLIKEKTDPKGPYQNTLETITPSEAVTWAITPPAFKGLAVAGKGTVGGIKLGSRLFGRGVTKAATKGASGVRNQAGKAALAVRMKGGIKFKPPKPGKTPKKPKVPSLQKVKPTRRYRDPITGRVRARYKVPAVGGVVAADAVTDKTPVGRFTRRNVEATAEDPGKVIATTARAAPGIIAGPAHIAMALGKSAATRDAGPTKEVGKSLWEFNKDIYKISKKSTSDKEAKKLIKEKYGLTGALIAAPGIAKVGKRAGPVKRQQDAKTFIGRYTAGRRARRDVGVESSTQATWGELEAADRRVIVKDASKAKQGKSKKGVRAENTLGLILEEGLTKEGMTPENLAALRVKLSTRDQKYRGGKNRKKSYTALDALDYLEANPHLWDDVHFKKANRKLRQVAVRERIKGAEKARLNEFAKTHGIRTPDERIAARDIETQGARVEMRKAHRELQTAKAALKVLETGATARARPRDIKLGITEAKAAVAAARRKVDRARRQSPEVKSWVVRVGGEVKGAFSTEKAAKKRAKELAASTNKRTTAKLETVSTESPALKRAKAERAKAERNLRAANRGANVKTRALTPKQSKRVLDAQAKVAEAQIRFDRAKGRLQGSRKRSDSAIIAETSAEVSKVARAKGLREPEVYGHVDVRTRGGITAQAERHSGTLGKKGYERDLGEGGLAHRGLVEYSAEALEQGTLSSGPKRRAAGRLAVAAIDRLKIKSPKSGKTVIGKGEAIELFETGQLNPKAVAAIDTNFISALKQMDDALLTEAQESLRATVIDQHAALKGQKGGKVILVERAGLNELLHQVTGSKDLTRALATGSRLLSKGILYNPAWAIGQVPATLATAAIVNPRLIKGGRALHKARKIDPSVGHAMGAHAGRVPGAAGSPAGLGQFRGGAEPTRLIGRFGRSRKERAAKLLLDSPSRFNRWSEGEIRQAALAANIDKQVNGWLSKNSNLYKNQRQLWEKLQNKPLDEQLRIIAKNEDAMRLIQRDTLAVIGDFATITHHEKVAAIAGVFYPFMRMSVKFLTYGLPAKHPIKAAVLWHLSQWNANELKKFLKGDPGFFAEWANVPMQGGKMLPLSRVSPGGSFLPEAIGEAAEGRPVSSLRPINPFLSGPLATAFGRDPLTDKPVEGFGKRAKLGASVTLGAPAPARLGMKIANLDRKNIFSQKEVKTLNKLLAKINPKGEGIARGFAWPLLPIKQANAQDNSKVSRAFDRLNKDRNDKTAKRWLNELYEKHGLLEEALREDAKRTGKKLDTGKMRRQRLAAPSAADLSSALHDEGTDQGAARRRRLSIP